jgi:DNA mismatch repair protein MutL
VKFVSDGDVVFRLAQGDLDRRIIDLFGDRQREFLLPVHEDSDLVRVQGYVGKPTFGQRSRFHQYLYLNGRMIVSRNINHAVLTAYEKLLPPGSFPFFVLFLSLDPRRIDVNVHPSKMEVKFDDEQGIHRLLASVVRKVLGSGDYVPAMTMAGREDGSSDATLTFTRRQHMWPAGPSPHGGTLWGNAGAFDGYTRDNQPGVPGYVGGEGEPVTASPGVRAAAALPTAQVPGDLEEVPPLWQLHNRYILAMVREGVLIIDQHVAHERILYEKALARMDGIGRSSQQLLFPFTLTLPASEFVLLEELLPHLGALGFDIKPFGKNAVMIEGVPADVRPGMEQGIVTEMLQLYREYAREAPLEVRDNLAKSFSCKSAVKSGDPLTEVEMRSLLQQLSTTHMPYVCPHGRPVSLRISLDEFDRRFGRR